MVLSSAIYAYATHTYTHTHIHTCVQQTHSPRAAQCTRAYELLRIGSQASGVANGSAVSVTSYVYTLLTWHFMRVSNAYSILFHILLQPFSIFLPFFSFIFVVAVHALLFLAAEKKARQRCSSVIDKAEDVAAHSLRVDGLLGWSFAR